MYLRLIHAQAQTMGKGVSKEQVRAMVERQDFNGTGKPDISMAKAVCLAIILNKDDDFSLTKGE